MNMMNPEQRKQIMQALWPEGDAGSKMSVWAILDCARDPNIYLALLASRLEFRCLYSGKLPRELEMVAPQLVELLPNHHLTDQLLDEGWGQAWGVFVRTQDGLNLRHHLRKLLKVVDEDGRRLLFRFYDPRVLRAYLPSCTPSELQQFFGNVSYWLTENERGNSMAAWSMSRGFLRADQLGALG